MRLIGGKRGLKILVLKKTRKSLLCVIIFAGQKSIMKWMLVLLGLTAQRNYGMLQ
jgi:hypothetical protein